MGRKGLRQTPNERDHCEEDLSSERRSEGKIDVKSERMRLNYDMESSEKKEADGQSVTIGLYDQACKESQKPVPLETVNGTIDIGTGLDSGTSSDSEKSCLQLFWDNLTRRDLKHFRKYISSTTTHGLSRIFVGRSRTRRLFWFLLFFTATVFCLNNCIIQIKFLANSPTSTRIEFTQEVELDFPAITVCNNNFVSRPNIESLQLDDYFECLAYFLTFEAHGITTEFRNCDKYLNSTQMNVPVRDVYHNGAQSAQDFIVGCSWPASTDHSNCSYENFTRIITSNGICYTFNIGLTSLVARGVGRRFSIMMLMDIQQYNYLNITSEAGVLVAIHSRLVPPRPLQTAIAIPPGTSADISLRYLKYIFPSQSCGNTHSSLNFFNTYNVPHCVLDRQYSKVADACKCIDPAAPTPNRGTKYANYANCTMSSLGCVAEQLISATETAKCERQCNTLDFSPKVSYLNFPAQHFPLFYPSIPLSSAAEPDKNFVQVRIFFEDFLIQNVIEEPSYDVIRLLADIGGQLGLFLGVSIISITEFLTWVLDELKDRLLCVNSCKQRARRRKTEKFKPANGQNELSLTNPVAISS
jgi:hypothetical protein